MAAHIPEHTGINDDRSRKHLCAQGSLQLNHAVPDLEAAREAVTGRTSEPKSLPVNIDRSGTAHRA